MRGSEGEYRQSARKTSMDIEIKFIVGKIQSFLLFINKGEKKRIILKDF